MNLLRLNTSTIALLALVLACVCGPVTPAAAIPVTTTLEIAVAVDIRCTIVASPVSFGNYDVSGVNATTPLDAVGAVTLNCDNGRRADVRLSQGLYPAPGSTNNAPLRRMANGTNRLTYNLYEDAAHTAVWDNRPRGVLAPRTFPTTLTVYGRIPAGQMVPSGAYGDSVLATVFF